MGLGFWVLGFGLSAQGFGVSGAFRVWGHVGVAEMVRFPHTKGWRKDLEILKPLNGGSSSGPKWGGGGSVYQEASSKRTPVWNNSKRPAKNGGEGFGG